MKRIYLLAIIGVLIGSMIPLVVGNSEDECALIIVDKNSYSSIYPFLEFKEIPVPCNDNFPDTDNNVLFTYKNRCAIFDLFHCDDKAEAYYAAYVWMSWGPCNQEQITKCMNCYLSGGDRPFCP